VTSAVATTTAALKKTVAQGMCSEIQGMIKRLTRQACSRMTSLSGSRARLGLRLRRIKNRMEKDEKTTQRKLYILDTIVSMLEITATVEFRKDKNERRLLLKLSNEIQQHIDNIEKEEGE